MLPPNPYRSSADELHRLAAIYDRHGIGQAERDELLRLQAMLANPDNPSIVSVIAHSGASAITSRAALAYAVDVALAVGDWVNR